MPESPSILILKEAAKSFNHKKVLKASGNAKIDFRKLENKTIKDFKTWGKHFLICFDGFFLRIHLLMFGTYRINEKKGTPARLSLQFKNGELNFYACNIQWNDGDADEVYDWTADVMNEKWSSAQATKKLKAIPDDLICDVLLEQDIFSGVGNIIKNEVLFRVFIHPSSRVGDIPTAQRKLLLKEVVNYSFDFLKWKKEGTLKKHWLAYSKKTCPRCKIPLHKSYPGKKKRRSFFCNNCQVLYDGDRQVLHFSRKVAKLK